MGARDGLIIAIISLAALTNQGNCTPLQNHSNPDRKIYTMCELGAVIHRGHLATSGYGGNLKVIAFLYQSPDGISLVGVGCREGDYVAMKATFSTYVTPQEKLHAWFGTSENYFFGKCKKEVECTCIYTITIGHEDVKVPLRHDGDMPAKGGSSPLIRRPKYVQVPIATIIDVERLNS